MDFMHLFHVIWILCVLPILTPAFLPYQIGEVASGDSIPFYYILLPTKIARLIPDNESFEILHSELLQFLPTVKLVELTHRTLSVNYFLSDPLPPINLSHLVDLDEHFRIILWKLLAQQEHNILLDHQVICDKCKNPSVMEWQNRIIMCTQFLWFPEKLTFSWVNITGWKMNALDNYLGISSFTANSIAGVDVWGIDGRLATTNETSFMISYANHNKTPMKMATVTFNILDSTSSPSSPLAYTMCDEIHLIGSMHVAQKNWIPFHYQSELYFIQRINPMKVIKLSPEHPSAPLPDGYCLDSDIISETYHGNIPWRFGEMRGGTNAIDIGSEYLAFFHSVHIFPLIGMRTYLFGAYTFTKDPPFTMLKVTPTPMIHEVLYSGPWFRYKQVRANYVPYPASVTLLNDALMVSVGWNDIRGFLFSIKLSTVLRNMIPVNQSYNEK